MRERLRYFFYSPCTKVLKRYPFNPRRVPPRITVKKPACIYLSASHCILVRDIRYPVPRLMKYRVYNQSAPKRKRDKGELILAWQVVIRRYPHRVSTVVLPRLWLQLQLQTKYKGFRHSRDNKSPYVQTGHDSNSYCTCGFFTF